MGLLFVEWDFNPVLISIGKFDLLYYSLTWVAAIWLGTLFFDYFCKKEGQPQKTADSIFMYGAIATMLGARVGHCLFYEPEYYLLKPWAIITEIRGGGLASHGAALGLLLGLWLFSRKNKMPYLWSLDRIMIPVGIGGALVRIGNLCNSEIFGYPTDLPWGFKFVRSAEWVREYAPAACHPTQIYEAILYLITFAVLMVMYYRYDLGRRRPGVMFGAGLIGIFLSRILIEAIKNTQVGFEESMMFNMGQLLSVPFVLLGVYMIWYGFSRPEVKTKVV